MSLKRHFLWWLGAGAAALVLAVASVQQFMSYSALARQQDARLVGALDSPNPDANVVRRVSRTTGERLEGDAALPAYTWPGELRAGDAPRLYFTRVGGDITRAAVALKPGPGGEAVVVQVAEPLARRLPGMSLSSPGPASAFAAGVLLMLVAAALAAMRARRWIVRALQDFDVEKPAHVAAPEELQPTLDNVRELQRQQRQWVDEQRRFLADAAHQLRTPMAVLRTQLQSALVSEADPRATLGEMLHTVDRAAGLANQLLSLTRIEQLKRIGQLQSMAIGSVVHEAVVELSPLIAQQRLDFALEGEEFEASADPMMLGELIRNLLANAIHHSPRGARLGIVMRPAPFREVVVWDEGAGIDDDVKPRLFTPFTAARGGVGLGLSICQQIGEAMGAQVRLYNRVEGGRTTGVDAVIGWRPAE
ncbi:ATP-binding protein [Ramlibacter sp. WS9]|uniref:sensor histidine kinase n=1 Tax=Ramlibacter sp. WS9 TaxID=1882741 RepID=UPI001E4A4D02|nr:ATP-binding protein [Ramlibacter sp. WS9]